MAQILCGLISALIVYFFLNVCTSEVRSQWITEEESCDTPTGEKGTCELINDCPTVINALVNAPKPLSKDIIAHLRKYTCGYEGTKAKVCCPISPVILGPNIGDKIPEPPDVTPHENYKLLPSRCGRLDTNNRIFNGQNASLYEFSWMALLSYNTSRGPAFQCGGTIINNRYILTAAHCISSLKSPIIGVRVGEYDISKEIDCQLLEDGDGQEQCSPPFQDVGIEELIPHESFNRTSLNHDIALIRVQQMDFTRPNIKPVCLPVGDTRNFNFTDKNVVITGWGATETARQSAILLKVEIPVMPLDQCREIYKKEAPIIYTQLCAGGKDQKDSCTGDSGGPLHVADSLFNDVRYVQQGVVSFGPKLCAQDGLPGVYTRVAYYMDWILSKIKP